MTALTDDALAYVRERARQDAFGVSALGSTPPDPAERIAAMMPALVDHLRYLYGGDPRAALRPDELVACYAAEVNR